MRGTVHLLALLVFAYSFALGTAARAESAGEPARFGPWLAVAAVVFVLAAALHALLLRSLARGPHWLRNVMAVALGGIAFGGVGAAAGLWSWPGGPTRVLGVGVVYGLLASFVPLRPDTSRDS